MVELKGLDKPDEGDCWWWFTEGIWQDRIIFTPFFISVDVYGKIMIPSVPKGFWYKAILPCVK